MADLRGAPAVPVEGGVGIGGQRGGVALEDRDPVPGPGQGQRRAQAAHAGPDDHDCAVSAPIGHRFDRTRSELDRSVKQTTAE